MYHPTSPLHGIPRKRFNKRLVLRREQTFSLYSFPTAIIDSVLGTVRYLWLGKGGGKREAVFRVGVGVVKLSKPKEMGGGGLMQYN